jgi:tetratricopeptide (TPR) repeat protein
VVLEKSLISEYAQDKKTIMIFRNRDDSMTSVVASKPQEKAAASEVAASGSENALIFQKSIAIGNSWNTKGLQMAQKDQWQEALYCWENALAIRLQILRDDHLDVANTFNNIGIAQGKLGRYREAIEALQRAQDIREKQLGESHNEVASTLHNIGNVFQQSEDFLEAVKYFKLSKKLHETQSGKDSVQIARVSICIGHCLWQAGLLEESLLAYNDAKTQFSRAGVKQDDEEVMHLMQDIEDVSMELQGSI